MTYKDPEWGMPTKLLGLVALVTILWWNFTSEVFFKPLSMGVIKSETGHWIMVSERLLPWGAVTGETGVLIQVIGRPDGPECQWHTEGLFIPRERNTTRYDISDWAANCLDAGPPISVRVSRSIKFLGFIPLRPVHYSFIINPDNVAVVEAPTQG